ncbi:anaerobic carbon-monoxide dehydrogenase catalytic subunit [Thermovibrio ammonificans]|uniref:Carbon monoxide dehydrogenase n=1 Tax=Thermovibrio ammonificans (strain DSM 15698 / JCM 12110 / HB-1) TaxID=648996 RepID=E8T3P3_THEA1|nr:anaerobic carbon-monoxide dehydrogenase catalytic subunit [Thermovibrio ammonificans]ADU97300.1 carbon-monoxide dehydrogenase, catalytic subunit [Thermovibrio ammonificans HB-1]
MFGFFKKGNGGKKEENFCVESDLAKGVGIKMPSFHESVNYMYKQVKEAGLSNVADRFEAMEKVRCKFCKEGVSCQLCSMGPCRITPQTPRGVCGIDAHGIVMRNLLIKANMGLAAYTYHCREAALTLLETARGNTVYEIKDPAKIDALAQVLGVDPNLPLDKKAEAVAEGVLKSLSQNDTSVFVEKLAPESRKEVFRKLGIMPKGPMNELVDSVTRSMTNIDGDYVTLALAALRNGVASAFGALVPLEMIQDALYGTPSPHQCTVDFGVLDPDYVNILPNGHEPFVGMALVKLAQDEKFQQMAREAGAKGIRIVGSIETGQEMMARLECGDVFPGLTSNWISIEYFLSTGAVDAFVMDMNCSLANLKEYADKYRFKLIAVSNIIGVPGSIRLEYKPGNEAKVAEEIIKLAIENFKERKEVQKADVSRFKQNAIVGFSAEAIVEALGGTLDPLLEVIKSGDIKGVVALVNCTSLGNGPQDSMTVQIAKELIKRDILVIGAGCGNAGLQKAGLETLEAVDKYAGPRLASVCKALGIPPVLSFGTCTDTGRIIMTVVAIANALRVDPSQLPVAVTAPEYMEQKAVIDGFSAVAMGLYTHVSPVPPVTGSDKVVKLLTEEVEALTGGKIAVGDDPVQAADGIEEHIMKKRELLGI